jgi:hypothetical protein
LIANEAEGAIAHRTRPEVPVLEFLGVEAFKQVLRVIDDVVLVASYFPVKKSF